MQNYLNITMSTSSALYLFKNATRCQNFFRKNDLLNFYQNPINLNIKCINNVKNSKNHHLLRFYNKKIIILKFEYKEFIKNN